MPTYTRCTVAELRDVCAQRNLQCEGLTKREMVACLMDYDSQIIDNVAHPDREDDVDSDDQSSETGDEVDGYSRDGDSVIAGPGPDVAGRQESESVIQLRLRLALIQEERQTREREWEIEQERMALHISDSTAMPRSGGGPDLKEIKSLLPTMQDSDILSFFMAFERVLESNDVDKSLWAKLLPGQLSAKGMKTFARLTLAETRDYESIKRAILASFKLDATAYLRMFRSMHRQGSLNYKMFLANLREVMFRYFDSKQLDTFEKLTDSFLNEQFLASLPEGVKHFVCSRRPTSAEQAADFADLHFELSQLNRDSLGSATGPRPYVPRPQAYHPGRGSTIGHPPQRPGFQFRTGTAQHWRNAGPRPQAGQYRPQGMTSATGNGFRGRPQGRGGQLSGRGTYFAKPCENDTVTGI